ncbi:septum formation protein Maf [bacterium]|nr:septum formation protein Maf [candidate division CSSED10-310 bacterium]
MTASLVLASLSPRRRDILQQIGISFDIIKPNYTEIPPSIGVNPIDYCMHNAQEKLRNVCQVYNNRIILSADTVVVLEDRILGKPSTDRESQDMLWKLSGKTHKVISAIALYPGKETSISAYDITEVTFRNLSQVEVDWYVKSGEGRDKAGGYGIQGKAAVFVRHINGCYFNIVGLPVALLVDLLLNHAPQLWPSAI